MKEPKWYLIVNPSSGSGKGMKHWKSIEKILNNMGLVYAVGMSEYHGHAIELAKQAVENGYTHLVAVGGDGTANEVINGMMLQQAKPTQQLTFGIIPVGTGNDWIKTHKIPHQYKKAILLLKGGHTKLHDIGKVHYQDEQGQAQSRYFINVAGLGYDAYVTKASNERRRWSNSRLFYLYLILKCSTEYKAQRLRISFDDQVVEDSFYSIAVGQCIFNGGGAQFVPHASPFDGLFALTLVRNVSMWDVLLNSRKFYNGRIVDHPQVKTYQVSRLRIESLDAQPTGIEVDGEYLGHSPVDFEMLPGAIQVLIP
jgi:YegS/Rv2252/BmrU family lipid kinase